MLVSDESAERIAPAVADRLVDTAGGNPLALVELPNAALGRASSRAASRSRSRCAPARPSSARSGMRVDALPEGARRALLIAATAHSARIDVIEAARAATAGLAMSDLAVAEEARLVSVRRRRARVPPSAAALDRLPRGHAGRAPRRARRAGRRRAGGQRPSAPGTSPRCAVAPDEAIAAALEAAALDARGRGAHATAARDFGRAAQLTPEDEPRARRLLEAATDATRCGEGEQARARLAEAARLTRRPAAEPPTSSG